MAKFKFVQGPPYSSRPVLQCTGRNYVGCTCPACSGKYKTKLNLEQYFEDHPWPPIKKPVCQGDSPSERPSKKAPRSGKIKK